MNNIYIVRHTESLHHVQKLAGGWHDTPLTERGKAQAGKIAVSLLNEIKLPGIPVYSSDLKRCTETADIFAQVFKSGVVLDENLREKDHGEGNGKPLEWLEQNLIPAPADQNILDHRNFKNAESRRETGQRAVEFINLLPKKPEENVLVITHGGISTFLIMAWFKVPVENMGYADFGASSGGVDLLSEDDLRKSRSLVYFNRLDFLNG